MEPRTRFDSSGKQIIVAEDLRYDNAASGLVADDVQEAIDELAGAGSGGTATVLTVTDETATLPNSRRLAAGANITFNDAVPGIRTISSSGGGGGGGDGYPSELGYAGIT